MKGPLSSAVVVVGELWPQRQDQQQQLLELGI